MHKGNAKPYNKKRRPLRVTIDDLVMQIIMLRTKTAKGEHKKLGLPGVGPYKIKSISEDGNSVTLTDPNNPEGDQWVVNSSRVKKFYARPEWMKYPGDDDVSALTGDPLEDMEIEENEIPDVTGGNLREMPDVADNDIHMDEPEVVCEDPKNKIPLNSDDESSESEELAFTKKTPRIVIPRENPHKLTIADLSEGSLEVDALVGNKNSRFKWKCGTIARSKKQGSPSFKVVGKDINAWVPYKKLCKCL